jgi:hypothetical protein
MAISVLNTDAGLSGKTIVNLEDAQTITGLKNFDRDPNPPFSVSANSAVVTNLDADKVDGVHLAGLAQLGVANAGHLIFTDATYDIGASGATRPRDLYLSRNAGVGGTLAVTGNATADSVIAVTRAAIESGGSPLVQLGVENSGGTVMLSEVSSDASAPSANRGLLYTRDNGAGKTQLVVRFNTGAVQVLATEP